MSELFHFGEYSVRVATSADDELLAAWIQADVDHSRREIPPAFFYAGEPGVGCYLLSDASGPILFFRTANTVRVHAQFGPSGTEEERTRNREALVAGFDEISARSAAAGASEIMFDTRSLPLEQLAQQRMGCERAELMVRDLVMERMGLGTLGVSYVRT